MASIVFDCTVSGLHLWGKHLVEEFGWMMLAYDRVKDYYPEIDQTEEEVITRNVQKITLINTIQNKNELNLYISKIKGYIASINLFALKLHSRIKTNDKIGKDPTIELKVESSTSADLLIIARDYIAILNMFLDKCGETVININEGDLALIGGSKTKQHGGKKGSKKSSKSSKKPSSKKSSVSKTQPSPKKGSRKASRKGSKKSAKKH